MQTDEWGGEVERWGMGALLGGLCGGVFCIVEGVWKERGRSDERKGRGGEGRGGV